MTGHGCRTVPSLRRSAPCLPPSDRPGGPGRQAVHAGVRPPAPRGSGGCSHGIHIPTGEGCAGRFAAGRGVARSSLTLGPCEPPQAQGARYALGAGGRVRRHGRPWEACGAG
nr:MAG TPA: hypothetical protein [Caudoviricetes sp.]